MNGLRYHGGVVSCPRCRVTIPAELCNTGREDACPSCGALVRAAVFPALFETGASRAGDVTPGASPCYFHQGKSAVAVCDSCGRFVCALCRVELSEGIRCPECIAGRTKKEEIASLVPSRTLLDSIALSVAVLPVLIFWITPLTAPLAIYLAIKSRKAPGSVLPRSRVRAVVALLVASLQIVGWVALGVSLL